MSEYTEAKREYKIEAVSEAVIDILRNNYVTRDKSKEYQPIKKAALFPIVEEKVAENWKKEKKKSKHVIHGKEIDCPDYSFINNNWSDIRDYCTEELNKYICWSNTGLYFGNEEDYKNNTMMMQNVCKGVAEKSNDRVDETNKRGGEMGYLELKIMLPSGK